MLLKHHPGRLHFPSTTRHERTRFIQTYTVLENGEMWDVLLQGYIHFASEVVEEALRIAESPQAQQIIPTPSGGTRGKKHPHSRSPLCLGYP